MRRMLEDAGYSVDIATANDKPMGSGSMTLTPTISLDDVSAADYAGCNFCRAWRLRQTCLFPRKVDTIVEQDTRPWEAHCCIARISRNARTSRWCRGPPVHVLPAHPTSPSDRSLRVESLWGLASSATAISAPPEYVHLLRNRQKNTDGTVELTQSFIESLAEAG